MSEFITNCDAQYAFDIVETICREAGPGIPGSIQERERASIIMRELQSHLGAENVVLEEFELAPDAFLSPYPGIMMLIATLLNISMGQPTGIPPWVTSLLALTLTILSISLFLFEFILSFEIIDPFLKKKQSENVVATLRKPGTKTVKKLLILSGHHDSAPENPWLRIFGYGFFFFTATYFVGLLTLLVMSIIQVAGVITGNAGIIRVGTVVWFIFVYPIMPAIIFAMIPSWGKKNGGTVPGAADNLSASALVVAMCRFLVENPHTIPEDTEIRFVSFGSEEAGLRGSRRYVARHLDELHRLDARLLNFETVAHPEINILTSDVNGAVKNSPGMVNSVIAAAQRVGVPYKVKPASLGVGTDAAPFSRAGLHATTLLPFKVPQQMVAFYHQRRDTPEVLSIEPLLNVLMLTFEWMRNSGE